MVSDQFHEYSEQYTYHHQLKIAVYVQWGNLKDSDKCDEEWTSCSHIN